MSTFGYPVHAGPVPLVDCWHRLVRYCASCGSYAIVDSLSDAQGILIRYPAIGWGGADMMPFDGAPDNIRWTTRWRPHGTGVADLTLLASVRHSGRSIGGQHGHYFVTQGWCTLDGNLPPELEGA